MYVYSGGTVGGTTGGACCLSLPRDPPLPGRTDASRPFNRAAEARGWEASGHPVTARSDTRCPTTHLLSLCLQPRYSRTYTEGFALPHSNLTLNGRQHTAREEGMWHGEERKVHPPRRSAALLHCMPPYAALPSPWSVLSLR